MILFLPFLIHSSFALTDCKTSLKVSQKTLPGQYLAINSRLTTHQPTGLSASSFFENSDETNCPITSCKLMEKGCKKEYIGK